MLPLSRSSYLLIVLFALSACQASSRNNLHHPLTQVEYQLVAALNEGLEAPETITYGDQGNQFIEYWPASDSAPTVGIVMVHGGCWLNAFGVDHVRAMAKDLQSRGYHVWSIEYNRLGDTLGGWPQSRNDITDALNYIGSQQQGLALDHTVVLGHSAGGHLALHSVEMSDLQPSLTLGLAAITTISTYAQDNGSCQRAAADFLQTANATDDLNVSPTSHHNRVLFYGGKDTIVAPEQAQLANTPRIRVDGAGHFDFIHPEAKAYLVWVAYIEQYLKQHAE